MVSGVLSEVFPTVSWSEILSNSESKCSVLVVVVEVEVCYLFGFFLFVCFFKFRQKKINTPRLTSCKVVIRWCSLQHFIIYKDPPHNCDKYSNCYFIQVKPSDPSRKISSGSRMNSKNVDIGSQLKFLIKIKSM